MGIEWGKERRSPMDTGGSGKGNGGTTKLLIFIAAIPLTAILSVAAYFVNAAVGS